MEEVKEIIKIPYDRLNSDLPLYIRNYLIEHYKKNSTKHYYILNIGDIVIEEIHITRGNSDCMASVKYLADILNPMDGASLRPSVHIGVITNIENRVIATIKERLNIMIINEVDNVCLGDIVSIEIIKCKFTGADIEGIGMMLEAERSSLSVHNEQRQARLRENI